MTNQQPPNTPFALDCDRAQDMIFDILESDANEVEPMTADAQTALDQHLSACDACRAYRHTMQHLNMSLSDIEEVPVPSGLEDRIMAAVSQSAVASPNGTSRLSSLFGARGKRYAPIAAALLVIAMAVPLIMQLSAPRHMTNGPKVAQNRHGQPTVGAPTSTHTPEPTQLASLPQAPQTAESERVSPTVSHAGNHTHADRKALTPISNRQSINGQQLAYNPAGQDTMLGSQSNTDDQNTAEQPDEDQSNGALAVDPSSLASAIPASANQQFSNTYSSETETDVYYDPVSNLVGF